MTTNSPNPVDGDVQAHQMPSAWIIETPDNGVRYVELKKDLADRVAQGCAKEGIRVVITPLYTTPPAQLYACQKKQIVITLIFMALAMIFAPVGIIMRPKSSALTQPHSL